MSIAEKLTQIAENARDIKACIDGISEKFVGITGNKVALQDMPDEMDKAMSQVSEEGYCEGYDDGWLDGIDYGESLG